VTAVTGGAAAAYAIAFAVERLCRRSAQDSNIVALSASYSNTAFIGLPICLVALGADSLGPATLVIAVNSSIIFGFGVVMCELLASAKASLVHSIRVALTALARNPLVLGSVLGIAWSFGRLPMPEPLEAFTRTLGGATAACALVAIGLFIARPAARSEPVALSRTLVLKLAVQPVATLGMLYLLPPLPALWSKTAILLAAMPTGTSSFLLAASFSPGMTNFSARTIVLSTLASVGTLSLVLVLLA
jgi:predicted permease